MYYSSSYRGGFAPRRGSTTRSQQISRMKIVWKPDLQKLPLGDIVKTYQLSDLEKLATCLPDNQPISDVEYVASYNWLSKPSPTIMIPGKPPQWTPPRHNPKLNQDSGQYYRDPNAARHPEYPLAPVVQAIMNMQPESVSDNVDVVACGSTLGNLLRFARGIDKAFLFDVELVGNSIFLLRKENDPKETIPDIRGFGHTFPEAYTTWEHDVKGSETHQRIVRYKLGNINCVVRFECDGYIKAGTTETDRSIADLSKGPIRTHESDDIANALELLNCSGANASRNENPQYGRAENTGVKVVDGGLEIPQHLLFDLKTRSGKYQKDIDTSDIYPQLWIKQIPNFIVAYHDGHGLFEDIRVQDVRKDIQRWEKENMDSIRCFQALLGQITAHARSSRTALRVYCPGDQQLTIYQRPEGERTALPTHLRDRWSTPTAPQVPLSKYDEDDREINRTSESSNRFLGDVKDEEEADYTGCSVETCGYCGKCTY